jgi:hypothetical protein
VATKPRRVRIFVRYNGIKVLQEPILGAGLGSSSICVRKVAIPTEDVKNPPTIITPVTHKDNMIEIIK